MAFAFVAPLAKSVLGSVATSVVKNKLGGGTKSKIPTMKTLSGASYDIVSHGATTDRLKPVNSSIFTKRVVNHGKSITEYADYERSTHPRQNPDHR